MARYRSRMVSFHDEVTAEELHEILTERLGAFEELLGAVESRLVAQPEKVGSAR